MNIASKLEFFPDVAQAVWQDDSTGNEEWRGRTETCSTARQGLHLIVSSSS